MQLIPVIEFEPSRFQTQERNRPSGSICEYRNEWDLYWGNSLADAGINGLISYHKGFGLVEVTKLTPAIMEIFLTKHNQINSKTTRLSRLDSGYIFQIHAVNIIPQCCSDFSDIDEWERASEWMQDAEAPLYNGNPCLSVRGIDSRYLQLRTTNGDNTSVRVDRHELTIAILTARQQLINFKKILLSAILNVCPHLSQVEALKITNELID